MVVNRTLNKVLRTPASALQRRDAVDRRGMSRWYDLRDWVGGYPFEVAKPEEIVALFHARHFALNQLRTVGGQLGCNQYVFTRPPLPT
jgi:2-polyprenyl-6-hydroxyphenyl methylase/3-demethylubiquinone-9 3-methyltransferase